MFVTRWIVLVSLTLSAGFAQAKEAPKGETPVTTPPPVPAPLVNAFNGKDTEEFVRAYLLFMTGMEVKEADKETRRKLEAELLLNLYHKAMNEKIPKKADADLMLNLYHALMKEGEMKKQSAEQPRPNAGQAAGSAGE